MTSSVVCHSSNQVSDIIFPTYVMHKLYVVQKLPEKLQGYAPTNGNQEGKREKKREKREKRERKEIEQERTRENKRENTREKRKK